MAAAAAAAPSGGAVVSNASSATTTTTTSRFAAACGALSQYVRAAEAEKRTTRARPPVVRPLPLMPGADVDGQSEEEPAEPTAALAAHQLTIVYGGRALVLDGVTADAAADLMRLAASASASAAARRGGTGTAEQPLSSSSSVAADLLPVERKASLQRFMEKRKGRVAAARAAAEPYRRRPAGGRRDDHLTLAL